ncbi:MAG: T9SS type A sorting domain-containing protein [Chitinophagales bacterium]|nr:T9SS type A sorting domain-containing protein [Chitinophagales bacterium]
MLLKTVGNVTSGSQLERFDVRQFAAGVYFLEMRDDKQTITRKVLISH